MKKIMYFLLLWVTFFNVSYGQISGKSELLKASKEYYRHLGMSSLELVEKIKSPISVDTPITKSLYIFDHENNCRVYLPSKKDVGQLVTGKKIYRIDFKNEIFKIADQKVAPYSRHRFFPFSEVDVFFIELAMRNLKFKESNNEYILENESHIYEFRKSDFSLKRIRDFGYEGKYNGDFYIETVFGECVTVNDLDENYLAKALQLISKIENKREWSKEVKSKETKNANPVYFDRSLLKKNELKIVNNNEDWDDNTIFIYFFYANCLPCHKSHPFVNRLFEYKNPNFSVIGIDPDLRDTLYMNQLLQRLDIKHPVIIGEGADRISRIPKIVKGYPTFLVIDVDGKILEYRNGYSKKFFREVEKKYLNTKLP